MKDRGEYVTLGSGEEVYVRNKRIRKDAATYAFHPCRGISGSVAVEDIHGVFIGWMAVEDLPGGPYENVQAWMKAVQWCGPGTP